MYAITNKNIQFLTQECEISRGLDTGHSNIQTDIRSLTSTNEDIRTAVLYLPGVQHIEDII